jgi:site-specific DNA recombinase
MTQSTLRCAIYTRKSKEEGLDQAFNSLAAQREACEAYIRSQAHEGWNLVKSTYDDGGFSGGSMERPAVKRLIGDVKQGLIDIVVVYKVDRLTRALADFGKIVEILDGNNASFVSITQQFNTTTSMGRLTLNVLLSFAQFEREVTSERIRDKLAASRRKGLWMGGTTPIGYLVKNRSLAVHLSDAKIVRAIFRRFLLSPNTSALCRELRSKGIYRSCQTTERGKIFGGRPFARGTLDHILNNKIYIGLVTHRGEVYPGQHNPIISKSLWIQVQAKIASNDAAQKAKKSDKRRHILQGLIWDDNGNTMSLTHAQNRSHQRYRYYVSSALLRRKTKGLVGSLSRVSAPMIESIVEAAVRAKLSTSAADRWKDVTDTERARLVRDAISKVIVGSKEVEILYAQPCIQIDGTKKCSDEHLTGSSTIKLTLNLKRSGERKDITTLEGTALCRAWPDARMLRQLAFGYRTYEFLSSGQARTLVDVAKAHECAVAEAKGYLSLGFLSPRLIDALVVGQPYGQNSILELVDDDLVTTWAEQERRACVTI